MTRITFSISRIIYPVGFLLIIHFMLTGEQFDFKKHCALLKGLILYWLILPIQIKFFPLYKHLFYIQNKSFSTWWFHECRFNVLSGLPVSVVLKVCKLSSQQTTTVRTHSINTLFGQFLLFFRLKALYIFVDIFVES